MLQSDDQISWKKVGFFYCYSKHMFAKSVKLWYNLIKVLIRYYHNGKIKLKGLVVMGINLNNPHDKFFKASFGRVDLARDFLKNYLPGEIDEVIDYRKMQLKNNTFIDEKLANYYSDLLYQTSIEGEDAYLYFLFEHKSYLDRWAVLQLLNYMLRIWLKEKAKSNPCKLPIIIPILFYHGKRSSNIKMNFREYFNNNEQFERFIPSLNKIYI